MDQMALPVMAFACWLSVPELEGWLLRLRWGSKGTESRWAVVQTSNADDAIYVRILSDAIYLKLFERSASANEIGAAIHLTPNANSVLQRLGIDPEDFGAVETEQVSTVFGIDGLQKK